MVKTKPVDKTVEKWLRRASAAVDDYRYGVENPRRPWVEAAKAAEPTWEAGVQNAIARKAYAKGVEAAGEEKWKGRARTVGAERYPGGIRAATDAYKTKISKVLAIIGEVELPARGPRGDERNYERVKAIGRRLHEARLRGEI